MIRDFQRCLKVFPKAENEAIMVSFLLEQLRLNVDVDTLTRLAEQCTSLPFPTHWKSCRATIINSKKQPS